MFKEMYATAYIHIIAVSPECSAALLAAGKRHLKDGIRLDPYERKPKTIVEYNDSVIGQDNISVIYGLESKAGENMTKVVRKMITDWNDRAVNGNLVIEVERMPYCPLGMDG